MHKNVVLSKLLCYGMFPERLEGVLTSKAFGHSILSKQVKLSTTKKDTFKLLSYKLTRNNNAPRYMGIPHPIAFVTLCNKLSRHWDKIEKVYKVRGYAKRSMILPKGNNNNYRLVSMNSYDKNPHSDKLQIEKQFGKKYYVHADVSECFPSIYTHSLCWALVGKKEAKKNRWDNKKWYNVIDKACRAMQDGQTMGIPIGPDSSSILSEVILSQIDRKLTKYSYIRYIDDYKCYCASKEEADHFIIDLSRELEDYCLKLNPKKTRILSLPIALNEDWVRRLRQLIDWDDISSKNKNKILAFLDLSSDLFRGNPSGASIRYACQVIKKKPFKDYKSYEMILRYFLNLCFLYPYIIDICDDLIGIGISTFPSKTTTIKKLVGKSLAGILKEHTKYRRSDVVTWSFFLAIKYDLHIANLKDITSEVLDAADCIPTLMCYLYRKANRKGVKRFSSKRTQVDEKEWWLFVYELSRIEKIKIANEEMEKLRKKKITFLSDDITKNI